MGLKDTRYYNLYQNTIKGRSIKIYIEIESERRSIDFFFLNSVKEGGN